MSARKASSDLGFLSFFSIGILATTVLELGVRTSTGVCGTSFGCEKVANSPLGRLLPGGWSLWGLGFLAIAGALLALEKKRLLRIWWTGGTAVSAGLILYSVASVRAFCPWCVLFFASLAGGTWLLLRNHVLKRPSFEAGLGLPLTAILAAVAIVNLMPRDRTEFEVSSTMQAEFAKYPRVFGAKDSDPVTVIDFGCPSCQDRVNAIARAKQPTIILAISSSKPNSYALQQMFFVASEQGLATKFFEIFPSEVLLNEWSDQLNQELNPTRAQLQRAVSLDQAATAHSATLGIRRVPATITFRTATASR